MSKTNGTMNDKNDIVSRSNRNIRKKCMYSTMTQNVGTSMRSSQQHEFAGSRMCLITQKQVQLFPYKHCKGSNLWVREREREKDKRIGFRPFLQLSEEIPEVSQSGLQRSYTLLQNVDCPGALWPIHDQSFLKIL
jgi:hypothetical protein